MDYPEINTPTSADCVNLPFVQTRMRGGAEVDTEAFNGSSELFSYSPVVSADANACINGDCSLPGETSVASDGCLSSVSVFPVGYDAPAKGSMQVRTLLQPLVRYQNATNPTSFERSVRAKSARASRLGNV